MSFEIVVVIVIAAIFALFFYGANRAEKVVEAKAAAKRESMAKLGTKAKKI